MKKFGLILLLLLGWVSNVWATHIVGGEFELVYLSGSNYQLTMNLYFDAINGNPAAKDDDATVFIFRKSDNVFMESHILPKLAAEPYVAYTNPECASNASSLSTRILKYRKIISLPAASYSSSSGYYVIWQRCCRNNSISNIIEPGAAGQVFYMEFPPVTKNSLAFINSSPTLFPPLSDYACVNEDFTFSFGGTDPDGDSLTYSMITPLNGYSSALDPAPNTPDPAPYSNVSWANGYSATNALNSQPKPLSIHPVTGLLTVRPKSLGLFVFSVLCQEYRNGVYIGQVRRDYQLLVKDCLPNNAPSVQLKNPATGGFYTNGDTIEIKATDSHCFSFSVKDMPLGSDVSQSMKIKATPVNFVASQYPFSLTATSGTTTQTKDSVTTSICFGSCSFTTQTDSLFKIDITATDDGCSIPKSTTLRLVFKIEPASNTAPILKFQANGNAVSTNRRDTVHVTAGQFFSANIRGIDTENDYLVLRSKIVKWNSTNGTLSLPTRNLRKDSVATVFSLQTNCAASADSPFIFDFILSDSSCVAIHNDTLTLVVIVDQQPNDAPTLLVNNISTQNASVSVIAGQTQIISLTGTDLNTTNRLTLSYLAAADLIQKNNIAFTPISATQPVEANIIWAPACNYKGDTLFTIPFVVTDDGCPTPKADTTWITFHVLYTPNTAPSVQIDYVRVNDAISISNSVSAIPTQKVTVGLSGIDRERDNLTVRGWIDDSTSFEAVGATLTQNGSQSGQLTATLEWPITCALVRDNPYQIRFEVVDNGCPNLSVMDSSIFVTVTDSADRDFTHYNVTTPNGDTKNDVFRLPDLPPDNCINQFVSVEIYNRWGKRVFRDTKRDFAWNAKPVPAGTYFYAIKYTNKSYRGWVDVLP